MCLLGFHLGQSWRHPLNGTGDLIHFCLRRTKSKLVVMPAQSLSPSLAHFLHQCLQMSFFVPQLLFLLTLPFNNNNVLSCPEGGCWTTNDQPLCLGQKTRAHHLQMGGLWKSVRSKCEACGQGPRRIIKHCCLGPLSALFPFSLSLFPSLHSEDGKTYLIWASSRNSYAKQDGQHESSLSTSCPANQGVVRSGSRLEIESQALASPTESEFIF